MDMWKRIGDERGFTLVEVLAALTVMAVIGVTITVYFVSALDRSAEESRRVIAANLARLKAAELRNWAKEEEAGLTRYQALRSLPGFGARRVFTENDPPFDASGLLAPADISGTTYRYEITLHRDEGAGSHTAWLNSVMDGEADRYLMRMIVMVYWNETADGPSPAHAVALDTYLVDRR